MNIQELKNLVDEQKLADFGIPETLDHKRILQVGDKVTLGNEPGSAEIISISSRFTTGDVFEQYAVDLMSRDGFRTSLEGVDLVKTLKVVPTSEEQE